MPQLCIEERIVRALMSVYDKSGIVAFAQALHALGVEIISTGQTQRVLREAGIPALAVSEVTGFPKFSMVASRRCIRLSTPVCSLAAICRRI